MEIISADTPFIFPLPSGPHPCESTEEPERKCMMMIYGPATREEYLAQQHAEGRPITNAKYYYRVSMD